MAQDHILIVGTGVFGLTTLLQLLQRSKFNETRFTVVSPSVPESLASVDTSSQVATDAATPRIASNDINRIIRPDYADPTYAELIGTTMPRWRETPGLSSHYHESGLLLTAETDTAAANYIAKSLANVKAQGGKVREFAGIDEMTLAMNASSFARAAGSLGYLNEQSGWVNAAGAMDYVWQQVAAASTERAVRFIRKPVSQLLFAEGGKRVAGAEVEGGYKILADLTLLALGAWTPSLLNVDGVASARGQCNIYVDLSDEEAMQLRDSPVHFNMSRGCFFFPPTRKENGGWEVKVARHAFGYSNPSPSVNGASIPAFPQDLPRADKDMLLSFLETCIPSIGFRDRPIRTRVCWYLDTASSDFIGCFHPDYGHSLFVAAGGSGHAFKFLPVLGERIADIVDGTDVDQHRGVWTKKWSWPSIQRAPDGTVKREIWCFDGSRAGVPGVTLEQALAGDRRAAAMPRSRL